LHNTTLTNCRFPVSEFRLVKEKVLNWAQRFDTFCFLDNHDYHIPPHSEECLLAAGVKRAISLPAGNALPQLQQFMDEKPAWLFGHLGFELKNESVEAGVARMDHTGFPDLYFFEPEIFIRFNKNEMLIDAGDPDAVFEDISKTILNSSLAKPGHETVKQRISRDEYLAIVEKLKQHILRGDCYEINFCQEFFAEDAVIEPLQVYKKLCKISPNPFASLYRVHDSWLICASPERFLKKTGSKILSQPIKGTSRRNRAGDEQGRMELYKSAKDRSENVMVVDLVRNDLAKICSEGTVQVDELFGIYSFPQVHQMISTVSGGLKEKIRFEDIIKATFPMGSMTGAPKKRVLQLIDRYEPSRRGIFSGAVGYISPDFDFDFNVVIRSILYNAATGYLSLPAGSGITFYSDAEKEWEECMMKAEAMMKALEMD
jgi:para-aminobenzoate synthetase component 1